MFWHDMGIALSVIVGCVAGDRLWVRRRWGTWFGDMTALERHEKGDLPEVTRMSPGRDVVLIDGQPWTLVEIGRTLGGPGSEVTMRLVPSKQYQESRRVI